MTTLNNLLDSFRNAAVTEREKGTYFEELICTYLRNEAIYRDLYSDVWTYADWALQLLRIAFIKRFSSKLNEFLSFFRATCNNLPGFHARYLRL
jgi:hypothetical protein